MPGLQETRTEGDQVAGICNIEERGEGSPVALRVAIRRYLFCRIIGEDTGRAVVDHESRSQMAGDALSVIGCKQHVGRAPLRLDFAQLAGQRPYRLIPGDRSKFPRAPSTNQLERSGQAVR